MTDFTEIKNIMNEQYDALAEWKAANDDRIKATILRLDGIETAMKRPGKGTGSDTTDPNPEHTAAIQAYLRTGVDVGLKDLEEKALSVGSDPGGGYLVLPEMSNRVM